MIIGGLPWVQIRSACSPGLPVVRSQVRLLRLVHIGLDAAGLGNPVEWLWCVQVHLEEVTECRSESAAVRTPWAKAESY